MTVYQTFRGLAICLLVSGSYALATAQDARESAYLRTGRLPYAGPPAPLPYADPPALLPYADLATPLPYAGPPAPLPYAGPPVPLPYAGPPAPLPYAGPPVPLPYAGPTTSLPHAGPTRALPYAGPTVPPDSGPTVPPSYTNWFSEVMGTKEPCVEYCSACPRVYAYGEFLFLQRSNCSRNQPMILALPPNSFDEETFFSTSDLSFDYDPAFRVLVGHRLHDGWALEASYFGLWSAASKPCLAPPDGNTQLIFPAPFGNLYSPVDRVWIRYSSAIQSGELNLVCCDGCCTHPCKGGCDSKEIGDCDIWCRTFEWFVGFRYLSVSERLRIDAQRFVLQADDTFGTETGFYDIRTRNNLFGPQIGARMRHWNDRLGWEAGGKVGLLYNDAQQRQLIVDFPDFEVRPRTGARGGQFAYMGELNVTGLFRLTDVWDLRAGYNVMYIGGLALAPNQLDFGVAANSGQQLHQTGGIFLHGFNLGFEARW